MSSSLPLSKLFKSVAFRAEDDPQLHRERFAVDDLILDLLVTTRSSLPRHSIRIKGIKSGVYLRADRELVALALTEFLESASKHSDPASTINVCVEALPRTVRITIHSTGSVVDRPGREAAPRADLFIARRTAELHRGRIWVTTQQGQGETFCLDLPRCVDVRKESSL